MKMKAGTRVLFTIFLIIIIAACLFVIATLFGLVDTSYISDVAYTMTSDAMGLKILYAAIAVVLIIIALILMFFGIRKGQPKTVCVASTENGNVVITVKALEELVDRYLGHMKHLKEVRQKVISYNEYIVSDVQIEVEYGVEIPPLTKELQDGLKEELEKLTGITVQQVRVSVMNIMEGKGASENRAALTTHNSGSCGQ